MRILPFFLILVLFLGCIQVPITGTEQPPPSPPPVQQPPDNGAAVPVTEPDEEEEEEEEEPEPAEEEEVVTLKSEEIVYNSMGWDIHGTLYRSVKSAPDTGIILVPMLGQTRDTYPPSFIKRLHDEIPNAVVLTIDPRGHGQSTSLGTYDDFGTFEFQAMQNDIVSAKQAITDRYPIAKQYYVVGASIGSTSAIIAGARDRDIVKIAMLSPGMEYQGVDIEDAADTYNRPLLMVAASGDSYSVTAMSQIESISTSQVTTKTYSGSAHGTDLFDATKGESEPLDDVILDFLK